MAVTVEAIRGVSERTDQSVDKVLESNTRLYQALGIKPDSQDTSIQALFPQELFESPEDMLTKSMELAQKVSDAWQPPNSNHHFRPNDDLFVQGLLDFGVYAVKILTESMPNTSVEDVEEAYCKL